MKNIFGTLTVAAALLSLAACNLDLYPTTSIVLDESQPLIQTENDLETYRWSNYAYFRGSLGGSNDVADDLMCDGFNATQNYGNNYGGIHRADQTFNSGDSYVESFWGNGYNAIRNYNILIEDYYKIQNEDLLEGARVIASEAYFFRAWTYLRLARRFGKYYDPETADKDLCVPLVLKYDQAARPARNTVKEVYDQIKADVDSSAAYLYSVAGIVDSKELTVDVLRAFLANYYLDIRDYEKAYAYADTLISSTKYTLCDAENVFQSMCFNDGAPVKRGQTEVNGNPEAIMKLPVSKAELPNGITTYTGYGADPNSPSGYSYKALYLPSKVLVDSYDATDFRYRNWFDFCKVDPFAYSGIYHKEKFAVFTRFKGNAELSASETPDGHVAPVPYSIAEIYLIAAEAARMGGSSSINALKMLKTLQEARKSKVSPTATLEDIQKEWFKETVGQGMRIECLKRWGLGCPDRSAQLGALNAAVLMTGAGFDERKLDAGDYHFIWPVPAYEIKVNGNLKQNEGYGDVDVE